ncbi:helix-turn-helix domain-containing protein [Euzebya pacifica]|uniref:helix-turn-helix domain-containing protein n=1 Tax=Euzebya pacifica TaxID=1608957 RepID=UPI000DF862A4
MTGTGELIRRARERTGLTQAAVARRIGISATWMSRAGQGEELSVPSRPPSTCPGCPRRTSGRRQPAATRVAATSRVAGGTRGPQDGRTLAEEGPVEAGPVWSGAGSAARPHRPSRLAARDRQDAARP